MPTLKGRSLLLDAGANVDCSPENLKQFALLGAVYVKRVWSVTRPRVGLLNIGGEAGKGNELTKEAYTLLRTDSPTSSATLKGGISSTMRQMSLSVMDSRATWC